MFLGENGEGKKDGFFIEPSKVLSGAFEGFFLVFIVSKGVDNYAGEDHENYRTHF